MVDIALCLDENCPSKLTCFRHYYEGREDVDDEHQTMADFDRPLEALKCKDYLQGVGSLLRKKENQ